MWLYPPSAKKTRVVVNLQQPIHHNSITLTIGIYIITYTYRASQLFPLIYSELPLRFRHNRYVFLAPTTLTEREEHPLAFSGVQVVMEVFSRKPGQ
jgi:hypothetical protein